MYVRKALTSSLTVMWNQDIFLHVLSMVAQKYITVIGTLSLWA